MGAKILKAQVMGFCAGVRRAIDLAIRIRSEFPERKIFTFGQLIHNGEALKFLESHQIYALTKDQIFETNENFSEAILVLCAHGTKIDELEKLERKFFRVIDGTCPHVIQNQKKAQSYTGNAKTVILVGEKEHQEVLSLVTHVQKASGARLLVVDSKEEAKLLTFSETDLPMCIMAQTTIQQEEYEEIVAIIKANFQNQEQVLVLQTICEATKKRQDALKELARNVDFLVVIGGKNSTNTKKLFSTALGLQENSILVENELELPNFPANATIGITAGASTPDFVIDRVVENIENTLIF